jgi:EamA domain-containing membrane protein RarD
MGLDCAPWVSIFVPTTFGTYGTVRCAKRGVLVGICYCTHVILLLTLRLIYNDDMLLTIIHGPDTNFKNVAIS